MWRPLSGSLLLAGLNPFKWGPMSQRADHRRSAPASPRQRAKTRDRLSFDSAHRGLGTQGLLKFYRPKGDSGIFRTLKSLEVNTNGPPGAYGDRGRWSLHGGAGNPSFFQEYTV